MFDCASSARTKPHDYSSGQIWTSFQASLEHLRTEFDQIVERISFVEDTLHRFTQHSNTLESRLSSSISRMNDVELGLQESHRHVDTLRRGVVELHDHHSKLQSSVREAGATDANESNVMERRQIGGLYDVPELAVVDLPETFFPKTLLESAELEEVGPSRHRSMWGTAIYQEGQVEELAKKHRQLEERMVDHERLLHEKLLPELLEQAAEAGRTATLALQDPYVGSEWRKFCMQYARGVTDPRRHSLSSLRTFLSKIGVPAVSAAVTISYDVHQQKSKLIKEVDVLERFREKRGNQDEAWFAWDTAKGDEGTTTI